MKSLGLIEIPGVTHAVLALDTMCKTADVEFVTWERKLGGRLVTVIVKGDVSAVTHAVERAVETALIKPAAHAVIANPHEEIWRMAELSASRMQTKINDINVSLNKETKSGKEVSSRKQKKSDKEASVKKQFKSDKEENSAEQMNSDKEENSTE